MYCIKVYVDKSSIHGIGVFAGEDIKKGDVVWRLVPGFDQVYTQEQFDGLPQQAQDYMKIYAYWREGRIYLCADQGVFCNHSEAPNVADIPGMEGTVEIALRDIKKGEEITSDYRLFDDLSRDDLETSLRLKEEIAA